MFGNMNYMYYSLHVGYVIHITSVNIWDFARAIKMNLCHENFPYWFKDLL